MSALPARPEPAPGQRPFLEATLALRAFDAALASGGFGEERRAELGVLEALRLKLEPLVEALRRIQLRAQRFVDRRLERMEAQLGGRGARRGAASTPRARRTGVRRRPRGIRRCQRRLRPWSSMWTRQARSAGLPISGVSTR